MNDYLLRNKRKIDSILINLKRLDMKGSLNAEINLNEIAVVITELIGEIRLLQGEDKNLKNEDNI